VQLTEFSSDSYALTIELRREAGVDETADSSPITARPGLNRVDLSDAPNRATIENLTNRKNKALHFRDSKGGIVGDSCLSIIGMIRPGRTVRLYRQIH
jgi:hypothetical protein